MRCTYLLLTCLCLLISTLVAAQDESAVTSIVSKIPSHTPSISVEKEIQIEAKDIIVNIGKVKIEIEKNKQHQDDHHDKPVKHHPHPTYKPTDKPTHKSTDKPTWKPTYKPTHKPSYPTRGSVESSTDPVETDPSLLDEAASSDTTDATSTDVEITPASDGSSSSSAEDTSDLSGLDSSLLFDDFAPSSADPNPNPTSKPIATVSDNTTLPLFEDFTPSAEPSADEVVLGENATAAAITVQGGEQFDENGVLILTGPQIFSVTFKIIKEQIITIKGSDLNVAGGTDGVDNNRPRRETVTFIIRGRGFVAGGNLFSDISDMVDGTSKGGMFDFLVPRVFLGAMPLQVVRFTDTTILARFLDIEDQRSFEAGTLLARVKVLHVDLKQENKKHGPGQDIGIMGGQDGSSTSIVSVGGLVLPALGAIGGSIPSGPVLGVVDGIGIDGKNNKQQDGLGTNSLLGLFAGLQFDTAVLTVQFSEQDAQKIRGSSSTLFTDGTTGFPDI